MRDLGGGVPGSVDVAVDIAQQGMGKHHESDDEEEEGGGGGGQSAQSHPHRRHAHHHHHHHPCGQRAALRATLGSRNGNVVIQGGAVDVQIHTIPGGGVLRCGMTSPTNTTASRQQRGSRPSWHAAMDLPHLPRIPQHATVRVDGVIGGRLQSVECSVRGRAPVFGRGRASLAWRGGMEGGVAEVGGGLSNGSVGHTETPEATTSRVIKGSSVVVRWRVGKVPKLPVVDVLPTPMVEVHASVGVRTRSLQSWGVQLCW